MKLVIKIIPSTMIKYVIDDFIYVLYVYIYIVFLSSKVRTYNHYILLIKIYYFQQKNAIYI